MIAPALKKLGAFGLATLLVIGAGIVFADTLVPKAPLKHAAVQALTMASGKVVDVEAVSRLSLIPRPEIQLQGVSIADREIDTELAAEVATASLTLRDLLRGKVTVATLRMDNARLRTVAPAVPLADLPITLRSFVGQVPTGLRLSAANIELTVNDAEPSRLDELSLRPSGNGRGLTLDASWQLDTLGDAQASVQIGDVKAFTDGDESTIEARLQTDLGAFSIAGHSAFNDEVWLSGSTRISTEDLAKVLQQGPWVSRVDATTQELIGFLATSVVLDGDLHYNAQSLSVRQSDVVVGARRFQGTISFDARDGQTRPTLRATLATNRFEFPQVSRDWVRSPWLTKPLPRSGDWPLSLDIRLSAGSVSFGELEAGPLAAAFLAQNGSMTLDISQSALLGGIGAAELTLKEQADGFMRTRLHVNGGGFDLAEVERSLFPYLSRPASPSARGDIRLRAEGTGKNLSELVVGAHAEATLETRNGTIGLDALARSPAGIDLTASEALEDENPSFARSELHFEWPNPPTARMTFEAEMSDGRIIGTGNFGLLPNLWMDFSGTVSKTVEEGGIVTYPISLSGPLIAEEATSN